MHHEKAPLSQSLSKKWGKALRDPKFDFVETVLLIVCSYDFFHKTLQILALFPSMVGATSHIVKHGGEVTDTKSSFKDDLPFSHPQRNGRRS
jgi:hypothetical protein